ncbi:MAG TPA: hypothetical protein VEH09_08025 [Thermodesulfobacteriota bacterium]|nr:hypothetical protein [Thermodesulfobacteriota bacterium]
MDRLAKQQACQLFIEQEIEKGLKSGKTTYRIGQEVADWIERLFQAKVKPDTIRKRGDRIWTNEHKNPSSGNGDGQPRLSLMHPVVTSVVGENSDLIAAVASLYLRDGMVVADVTYGKGVFWKKVDTSRFDFRSSDITIITRKTNYDFRSLPYAKGKIDVLVFDPPYIHTPGRVLFEANYRNGETTKGMGLKGGVNERRGRSKRVTPRL